MEQIMPMQTIIKTSCLFFVFGAADSTAGDWVKPPIEPFRYDQRLIAAHNYATSNKTLSQADILIETSLKTQNRIQVPLASYDKLFNNLSIVCANCSAHMNEIHKGFLNYLQEQYEVNSKKTTQARCNAVIPLLHTQEAQTDYNRHQQIVSSIHPTVLVPDILIMLTLYCDQNFETLPADLLQLYTTICALHSNDIGKQNSTHLH